jgi:hypothetical protein
METKQLNKQENWFTRFIGNRYLVFVFRILLGGIFLVSSLGKLVDIERYSVDVVYTFGVLPMKFTKPAHEHHLQTTPTLRQAFFSYIMTVSST